MKQVLYIVNYRPGVGGISGQVEFLYNKIQNEAKPEIFNTKGGIIKRLLLLFKLISYGKKFDVFHVHGCSNWGGFFPIMLGVSVGKLLRKKTIVTYHGGGAASFFEKNKNIVYYFLNKADQLIVLSEFLEEIFNQLNLKVKVIPNLIDLETNNLDSKKELSPKFICTRSFESLYNINTILDAFSEIQKHFPNATLTLVGDGSLKEELINHVESNSIHNVTFVGRVNHAEINNLLKKADIWLNASLVDNMPVSLLEANNIGLLVISSDSGGIKYMVNHLETGLLVETIDSNGFSDSILLALSNQELALKMIKNAKENLKKYTWDYNKSFILDSYFK